MHSMTKFRVTRSRLIVSLLALLFIGSVNAENTPQQAPQGSLWSGALVELQSASKKDPLLRSVFNASKPLNKEPALVASIMNAIPNYDDASTAAKILEEVAGKVTPESGIKQIKALVKTAIDAESTKPTKGKKNTTLRYFVSALKSKKPFIISFGNKIIPLPMLTAANADKVDVKELKTILSSYLAAYQILKPNALIADLQLLFGHKATDELASFMANAMKKASARTNNKLPKASEYSAALKASFEPLSNLLKQTSTTSDEDINSTLKSLIKGIKPDTTDEDVSTQVTSLLSSKGSRLSKLTEADQKDPAKIAALIKEEVSAEQAASAPQTPAAGQPAATPQTLEEKLVASIKENKPAEQANLMATLNSTKENNQPVGHQKFAAIAGLNAAEKAKLASHLLKGKSLVDQAEILRHYSIVPGLLKAISADLSTDATNLELMERAHLINAIDAILTGTNIVPALSKVKPADLVTLAKWANEKVSPQNQGINSSLIKAYVVNQQSKMKTLEAKDLESTAKQFAEAIGMNKTDAVVVGLFSDEIKRQAPVFATETLNPTDYENIGSALSKIGVKGLKDWAECKIQAAKDANQGYNSYTQLIQALDAMPADLSAALQDPNNALGWLENQNALVRDIVRGFVTSNADAHVAKTVLGIIRSDRVLNSEDSRIKDELKIAGLFSGLSSIDPTEHQAAYNKLRAFLAAVGRTVGAVGTNLDALVAITCAHNNKENPENLYKIKATFNWTGVVTGAAFKVLSTAGRVSEIARFLDLRAANPLLNETHAELRRRVGEQIARLGNLSQAAEVTNLLLKTQNDDAFKRDILGHVITGVRGAQGFSLQDFVAKLDAEYKQIVIQQHLADAGANIRNAGISIKDSFDPSTDQVLADLFTNLNNDHANLNDLCMQLFGQRNPNPKAVDFLVAYLNQNLNIVLPSDNHINAIADNASSAQLVSIVTKISDQDLKDQFGAKAYLRKHLNVANVGNDVAANALLKDIGQWSSLSNTDGFRRHFEADMRAMLHVPRGAITHSLKPLQVIFNSIAGINYPPATYANLISFYVTNGGIELGAGANQTRLDRIMAALPAAERNQVLGVVCSRVPAGGGALHAAANHELDLLLRSVVVHNKNDVHTLIANSSEEDDALVLDKAEYVYNNPYLRAWTTTYAAGDWITAHMEGIIHTFIKPNNIVNVTKLIDALITAERAVGAVNHANIGNLANNVLRIFDEAVTDLFDDYYSPAGVGANRINVPNTAAAQFRNQAAAFNAKNDPIYVAVYDSLCNAFNGIAGFIVDANQANLINFNTIFRNAFEAGVTAALVPPAPLTDLRNMGSLAANQLRVFDQNFRAGNPVIPINNQAELSNHLNLVNVRNFIANFRNNHDLSKYLGDRNIQASYDGIQANIGDPNGAANQHEALVANWVSYAHAISRGHIEALVTAINNSGCINVGQKKEVFVQGFMAAEKNRAGGSRFLDADLEAIAKAIFDSNCLI